MWGNVNQAFNKKGCFTLSVIDSHIMDLLLSLQCMFLNCFLLYSVLKNMLTVCVKPCFYCTINTLSKHKFCWFISLFQLDWFSIFSQYRGVYWTFTQVSDSKINRYKKICWKRNKVNGYDWIINSQNILFPLISPPGSEKCRMAQIESNYPHMICICLLWILIISCSTHTA